jgi:hypothetical protein
MSGRTSLQGFHCLFMSALLLEIQLSRVVDGRDPINRFIDLNYAFVV